MLFFVEYFRALDLNFPFYPTIPGLQPRAQGSHSTDEAIQRMNATAQAIDETLHALLGTAHHSDIQALF